ncbi:MAG: transcription-repair coupling factor [Elusimicrobia bacterium]|nr:transcription-repair coupling factor [Elusimicrobiota bacterium]
MAEKTVGLALRGVPNAAAWGRLAMALLEPAGPPGPLKAALGIAPALPIVVVRSSEEDLEDAADAARALGLVFPEAGEAAAAVFGEDPAGRLAARERLHAGARLVFATPAGLGAPAAGVGEYAAERLVVRAGGGLKRQLLLDRLTGLGYQRVDFVESPGEFAARGAVVDFHTLEPALAVRALYDVDKIVSVKSFDPATQTTRREFLDSAVVGPAVESPSSATVGSLLAAQGTWLVEPGFELPGRPRAVLTVGGDAGKEADLGWDAFPAARGGIEAAAAFCAARASEGWKLLLFSMTRGEDERLQEMLEGRVPEGAVQFLVGPLRQGFVEPAAKRAFLSSAELFGRTWRLPRWKAPPGTERVRARWRELRRGDFVVHEQFGVARYLGLEAVHEPGSLQAEASGGTPSIHDCLSLEFRGGDRLFLPMADFKRVQKYVAAEGARPRLSSLDTKSWADVKARVEEGVRELAQELLKRHAERVGMPGHAFSAESRLEVEFAESFPYEETPDQAKAIAEVKADMEEPHPMDRIVVGDVGFGKTEVAMRACLKCAAGLKQAAVLVPTTVLADQHLRTFRSRFAEYPVRVEGLSRFATAAEQKAVIEALKAGKVDIVVGTHRLLSADVRFKDLGLVVVDEEHRFGVKDKERLKALRARVDCLTLSATPIPRTLHQGLSGLRGISLIQSAPTGRLPITTEVRPYDEKHVKAAIEAELARGGQVFYVHNRVKTLPEAAEKLAALVPGARLTTGHGQMKAETLEKAMWDFHKGKYDVLVASTIIESGLDIPTVNTLLVEDAQDFGLAQLYQLRGRIGRERRRATCVLYYPGDAKSLKSLSEDASRRLEALRQFRDLGSGLGLAMRDLEIRGAGDLLGARQHGYINAVGVEYYSRLLETEVERLRGRRAKLEQAPAQLDLSLPAFVPETYLPGDLERLRFYKRALDADEKGLEALHKEVTDISGPPPAEVENLFAVLRLRRRASTRGVRAVAERAGKLEIYLHAGVEPPPVSLKAWLNAFGGRLEFARSAEGDGMKLTLGRQKAVEVLDILLETLPDL